MPDDKGWMRRHAIQIAAQLPEDPNEALAVLELAKQLVRGFLMEGQTRAPLPERADVVRFPAAS